VPKNFLLERKLPSGETRGLVTEDELISFSPNAPRSNHKDFHEEGMRKDLLGKGEIMFDINRERSSFKFRPQLEECNMIEVKNVPPQRRVVKEEPRKKERAEEEESAEEEGRKENQGNCCIRQDKGRKAACEDQKNDYAKE
jgi:hypothetical protein